MKKYSFLQEAKVSIKNADNTLKNIKKAYKVGKAISTPVVAATAAIKLLVTTKINSLIKVMMKVETREEAERILLNSGYIVDNTGMKRVVIGSLNYFFSNSVVGPAIQIVKNESDLNWKLHLLKHLRLCRTTNFIMGITGSIVSAVGIASFL